MAVLVLEKEESLGCEFSVICLGFGVVFEFDLGFSVILTKVFWFGDEGEDFSAAGFCFSRGVGISGKLLEFLVGGDSVLYWSCDDCRFCKVRRRSRMVWNTLEPR